MSGHRSSIEIIKQASRIGSFNVRTLHEDGCDSLSVKQAAAADTKFHSKLAELTGELEQLSVGLCGIQECRLKHRGDLTFSSGPISSTGSKSSKYSPSTGPWQLIWSGGEVKREFGVGLLLSSAWQQAMLEHSPISDRLLLARFQCQSSMTLSVLVAYAPTDGSSQKDMERKQQFYLHIYSALQRIQNRDLVMVLGDFNAQIGEMLRNHQLIRGPHTAQPAAATDNGMRLLDLASAHGLVLANTLFPHKDIHYHTHRGATGNVRVIDYILCSSRFRTSIRDYRVFRGVGGSDHRLLVCTVQLQLSTQRQSAPFHAVGPSSMRLSADCNSRMCNSNLPAACRAGLQRWRT